MYRAARGLSLIHISATFEFLILSLKAQTEMHLGMYHFGEEKDRPDPDFRIARHTIDLLAMLQEKTRGNVSMEEQRLVDNALTELRFRFVQAMEDVYKRQTRACRRTIPGFPPIARRRARAWLRRNLPRGRA